MDLRCETLGQPLQKWMEAYNVEKIEDIFENGFIKVQPLQDYFGNYLKIVLKYPFYTIKDDYVIQYISKSKYYQNLEANQMFLQLSFSSIGNLLNQEKTLNPHIKLYEYIKYTTPKILQTANSSFERSKIFTVLLKGEIGIYTLRNEQYLINSDIDNINIRAVETNIVQFLTQRFPYSAVINFTERNIFIHPDLNEYFQLKLPASNISTDLLKIIEFLKQSSSIQLQGWSSYDSFAKSPEHGQVQTACASYLCIYCCEDEVKSVRKWASDKIGFLPAIFIHENTTNLPSYIPYKSSYIAFSEYEKMNNPPKIDYTTTQQGIKIMSWNVQNQSNLGFQSNLSITFPFTSWQSYKYQKITQLILKSKPDICFFSSAGPIDDIYKTQPEINNQYNLVKCVLDSITKLCHGNQVYTVILVSKKHKLLHMENIPFSILSYNIGEAVKLGVINPTRQSIKQFNSFNCASFAVIEINGKKLAVSSIYANWQIITEVMKYLQIKLTCNRVSELYREFNCQGKIVAGDFNIMPISGIYKSFSRKLSAQEADELNDLEVQKLMELYSLENERKFAKQIKFQGVVKDLRIEGFSSVFKEEILNDVEGLSFKEPITTKTAEFKDCLDYIMTDLKVKQKCKPYCETCDDILPNSVCVSDHAPLLCVVDFE